MGSILKLSLERSAGSIFAPFIEAINSAATWRVVIFTFWQAILSTLLTLALGLPGAYLLAHYEFKGKALLQALTGIPFLMPTLVVAAAFNALLGPNGWINIGLTRAFHLSTSPIHFTNTLIAILVAHVFYNTTIVLRMVGDFWSHLDPRLSQAARMLGASRWQALRKVTFPLLAPAIVAAALLVFIFDFTSFGVILILGGPRFATLEVEIYYQTISLFNLPLAAVLCIIQLICTLGLTIIYTRLLRRLSIPLSLKSRRVTQRRLSTLRSKVMAGIIIITLLVLLILPLAALMVRSVTHLEPNRGEQFVVSPGFTLDFYRALFSNTSQSIFYAPPTTAIVVSLGYATATTVLALLLGFPAALALSRAETSPVSRGFDALLMLPLGTSAVTLGLGFIVALDKPPLDLRSSLLLVPLAHTLVAFPFVVRNLTPALRSIRPRIRQAAAMLGASPSSVLRFIDLPLITRSLIVAAAFAFTISLGEFGATALIARPEYPTVPIAIYRLFSRPGEMNYGQALALSTILMLVAGAGMLLIDRLRIGDIGEF
ncbi:MAG: iron ABC transporter permease [Anaerolineales bacterium]|nr:MAG: iron ABC transporter permease [Anaerolineales bacterium]